MRPLEAEFRDSLSSKAIWKLQRAAENRVFAEHVPRANPIVAIQEADRLEHEANAALELPLDDAQTVGVGGEFAPIASRSSSYLDTARSQPDMIAVDASKHRLGLIDQASVMALALDAAETVQVTNSLEKMLVHQASAAHDAAMRLQVEAMHLVQVHHDTNYRHPNLNAEAVRLMNASARMMDATQKTISALHRLRHSGRQTMVVQHVHVSDGGQAVVAGELSSRAEGRARMRGA